MNKNDIINEISQKHNIKKKDLNDIIDSFFEIIMTEVQKNKISLPFGSFEVVETKARTGRNPQTQTKIEIPASKKVKFKPNKLFKDKIKG